MLYIERLPGASRIANALAVTAVVTITIATAIACVYLSAFRVTASVNGIAVVNQAEVLKYRSQVAAAEAAGQNLIDNITGIITSASDYGLSKTVDPAKSPEVNLQNFRSVYCLAVSNGRSLGIKSVNFVARTFFERFQDRGLLPLGDFETVVSSQQCGKG